MSFAARLEKRLSAARLSEAERRRFDELAFHDAGHGYDELGFHPESLVAALALGRFWYEKYFRVESHGIENVPHHGSAILVANHSGLLPIDAAMIVSDVAWHTNPPRVLRSIGDLFIPFMPWVGTTFARIGMVSGTRNNFSRLLENGELVLVFPEGTPGIGKGFSKRYQLQPFRVGHAELALARRVPVIPVAVIGAEESWPGIARLNRFHAFGAPFLPIPATPLPLPVKYRIYYGEPLRLDRHLPPEHAEDPLVSKRATELVQARVAALIDHGLRRRKAGLS